jgi:hypothetical protein
MEFLANLLGKTSSTKISEKEIGIFERLGRVPYDNRYFMLSKAWFEEWKNSYGNVGAISHTALVDQSGRVRVGL